MNVIHCADASCLPIPDNTVQCCVTSPPYYGLRDYGMDGQIGLESTPDEYVAKLVQVFREVKRALKDDGTLWLNIGDSYVSNPTNQTSEERSWEHTNFKSGSVISASNAQFAVNKHKIGKLYKPKDLIGIPWMVAFALRADGWYLRSDIIWAKPNPMPESVKDRPTKSHEYLFLLTKSARYYYDAEAIFEPANYDGGKDTQFKGSNKYDADTLARVGGERWPNKIRGFKEKDQLPDNQHHGSDIDSNRKLSEQNMSRQNSGGFDKDTGEWLGVNIDGLPARNKRSVWTINTQPFKGAHFAVMPEKLVEPCIMAGSRLGDIILDPFCGSGTVGVVAQKNGRNFIGIELNPEYIKIAESRLKMTPVSLFNLSQEVTNG